VVLAGYSLLAACTQLLWLSFAPITAEAHRAMGVSEGAIGDLAGIFPLVYVILALPHNVAVIGIALFVGGFLLLAGLPVALDWSELHAGPERAGAAAGFLLLAGNLGGVVLVLVVQATIGNPYLSLGAFSLAALAGLALAAGLPARTVAGTD